MLLNKSNKRCRAAPTEISEKKRELQEKPLKRDTFERRRGILIAATLPHTHTITFGRPSGDGNRESSLRSINRKILIYLFEIFLELHNHDFDVKNFVHYIIII